MSKKRLLRLFQQGRIPVVPCALRCIPAVVGTTSHWLGCRLLLLLLLQVLQQGHSRRLGRGRQGGTKVVEHFGHVTRFGGHSWTHTIALRFRRGKCGIVEI